MDGDSFTLTTVEFLFHSVTDASRCLVFGPGLLNNLATMEEVVFFVQAKDETNANRTTGEDEFTVLIRRRIWEEDMEEPEFKRVRDVIVEDMEDGTYMVRYTAPAPGDYVIEVEFKGTFGGADGPVRGSPVTAVFDDYAPRSNNSFTGELMKGYVEAEVKTLAEFAQTTLAAIQAPVQGKDWTDEQEIEALAKVKGALFALEERRVEMDLILDRTECTIAYLNSVGKNLGPIQQLFAKATRNWERILREAPRKDEFLKPLLKARAATIRATLREHTAHVEGYTGEIEVAAFKFYATEWAPALGDLDQQKKRLEKEDARCDSLLTLAAAFECTREMQGSIGALLAIKDVLIDYRVLWEQDRWVWVWVWVCECGCGCVGVWVWVWVWV